jgi:hypothetical protein
MVHSFSPFWLRHSTTCLFTYATNIKSCEASHNTTYCSLVLKWRSNEIIKTAQEEVSSLKHKDVLILWGGSNDINRNNTKEALKNLSIFMNSNKNVNTVLINSPHRYDLMPSSCVNNEVAKFNRQIKKIVKLHENLKFLEVKLQREHFTKHGQYLNNSGKELVSLELAKLVEQLVNKKIMRIYIVKRKKVLIIVISRILYN